MLSDCAVPLVQKIETVRTYSIHAMEAFSKMSTGTVQKLAFSFERMYDEAVSLTGV